MTDPQVLIGYVCVSASPDAERHAQRFVETYRQFPPGYPHKLIVICNGGLLPPGIEARFQPLKPELFIGSNVGWDVSGYLELADAVGSDLQVCLGESVHFWRSGWLQRIVDAWHTHGPGMFGCYSSYLVSEHLNTTAFAVSPKFLKQYPAVRSRSERYQFEHGQNALWRRIAAQGGCAKLVTWDGVYGMEDWRKPLNILWRGDESNCLVWSNHTERYKGAAPEVKRNWEMGADGFMPVRSTEAMRPRLTPGVTNRSMAGARNR